MNILFVNLPFKGHTIPTLGLVRELVARNNKVTYVLTPEWKESIVDTGAEFVGYDDDKKLSVQIRRAYDTASTIVENFDLVIYEQYFFLGYHLAEQFNKPAVRIFTSPASNEKLMAEYINSGGGLGIFKSKWICRQWTKQVSKGIKLKTDCWLNEILENTPDLNLVYTIREFQPYVEDFESEHYKFIGSSIGKHRNTSNFQIMKNNQPLVFISLGTVVNKAKSFYRKCIAAFINEDLTVIMSIGKTVNISSLGKIPSNIFVYPFVPQLEVLEKADLFITHGGLNSVTEAIYFGVPMVVMPIMNDQPVNASRIEALNIGRKLNHKTVTSEILKSTTICVLGDKTIKENVLSLQNKMRSVNGNEYGADLIMKYRASLL